MISHQSIDLGLTPLNQYSIQHTFPSNWLLFHIDCLSVHLLMFPGFFTLVLHTTYLSKQLAAFPHRLIVSHIATASSPTHVSWFFHTSTPYNILFQATGCFSTGERRTTCVTATSVKRRKECMMMISYPIPTYNKSIFCSRQL